MKWYVELLGEMWCLSSSNKFQRNSKRSGVGLAKQALQALYGKNHLRYCEFIWHEEQKVKTNTNNLHPLCKIIAYSVACQHTKDSNKSWQSFFFKNMYMKNTSASREVPKSLQCKLNTISFFWINSATISYKKDELKVLA